MAVRCSRFRAIGVRDARYLTWRYADNPLYKSHAVLAVRDGRLVVSSIYDWFESDFGGDDAGVIAHLRQYAEGDLAAELADVTSVSDDRYDWDLNDAETPKLPKPVRARPNGRGS